MKIGPIEIPAAGERATGTFTFEGDEGLEKYQWPYIASPASWQARRCSSRLASRRRVHRDRGGHTARSDDLSGCGPRDDPDHPAPQPARLLRAQHLCEPGGQRQSEPSLPG